MNRNEIFSIQSKNQNLYLSQHLKIAKFQKSHLLLGIKDEEYNTAVTSGKLVSEYNPFAFVTFYRLK